MGGEAYFGRDLEAMSFAGNYHEWVLDLFGDALQGRVAEVGAGSGNLSRMILSRGAVAELRCFEPSSNMFPLLEERLRGESRASCVNDFFGTQPPVEDYDAILYANVLEHVPEDRRELGIVRERLRPGGRLLVFVPAGPWLMSDFDRSIGHHRRYTKRDLIDKVRGAGFLVDECRHVDSLGVLPWFLMFVLLRRTLSGGSVSLYDRVVVPWLRRLEAVCPPPFGKNLLLIARRLD